MPEEENDAPTMDWKTYNAIYAANRPFMEGIYNESGFDPRIAHAQLQMAQKGNQDWHALAHAWHGDQPHPKAPSLMVKEYDQAVKLATQLKFGGHASAKEAELFWHEFKQTGLSSQEFQHLAEVAAPVAFALHGRPPSLYELMKFKDQPVKAIHDYFGQLPDANHPEIPAGEMARHLKMAEPWALLHLGRRPTKSEASYLFHAKATAGHVNDYYQTLKADSESKEAPAEVGFTQ